MGLFSERPFDSFCFVFFFDGGVEVGGRGIKIRKKQNK